MPSWTASGRPLSDPLAALFPNPRPLGAWVAEAACADLPDELVSVFIEGKPDSDALDLAEATCWRCPPCDVGEPSTAA